MTDTMTDDGALELTESAAQRISELVTADGNPDLMLRLAVSGGGCSGFQYEFSLDDTRTGEDVIIEAHGAKMVVDETSLGFLGGSQVDFVRELVGASFKISNPNATSSCGCGSSFSV